ncbi:MAG TPA: dTMP kinase [Candidatus Nanopelagicales bacterium]|nr:dTMP kinase [Candidatus Nanopelagicales bacterium]
MEAHRHARLPIPAPPAYDGLFIALEGGEGAGKSTQCRLLGEHLTAAGVPHLLTREPGGNPAAEAIRDVVLHPRYAGLDPRSEALLFAAARGEHVRDVILPALRAGQVVLTDRYLDSSVAYQGVGRGLGQELVEGLSLWATGGLVADLTVVLDVDERTGLGRVAAPDRLEAEPEQFHATVRRAFLDLAARDPERYLVLDATEPAAALAGRIAARVDRRRAAAEAVG